MYVAEIMKKKNRNIKGNVNKKKSLLKWLIDLYFQEHTALQI